MKRTISDVNNNSISKFKNTYKTNNLWDNFNRRSIIYENITNNTLWISPSSIRNYMMKDPIIDWLKLKYISDKKTNNIKKNKIDKKNKTMKNEKNINPMLDLLFKMGIEFENKIFDYLEEKYKKNVIKMDNNKICDEICDGTIQCMKKGIPIILHGQVKNYNNMTCWNSRYSN